MKSLLITGGVPLKGIVNVFGSKGSSIPLMAASLLAVGRTVLCNAPRLPNVDQMSRLLGELGCDVFRHGESPDDLDIIVTDESSCEACYDVVKTMRASICVLGPLLAKRGKAIVTIPDAQTIACKPVDQHVNAFRKMGADFRWDGDALIGEAKGRLKGCDVFFTQPTVLGTVNVMYAAALAKGDTLLSNVPLDPEIDDCISMLKGMGARVDRIGHNGVSSIWIQGVEKLVPCRHVVMPDRIECGTLMIAAAITRGNLTIAGGYHEHLGALISILREIGVAIDVWPDGTIQCSASRRLDAINGIMANYYPALPSDLQAQLTALLCLSNGESTIQDRVFPDRVLHVGELNRMGAKIKKDGPKITIEGVESLTGAPLMASDLRASAALILAGLAANGTTRIDRIYHVDKGYHKLDEKLASVGAQIERADDLPRSAAPMMVIG